MKVFVEAAAEHKDLNFSVEQLRVSALDSAESKTTR